MSQHVNLETLFAYQREQLSPIERSNTQHHLTSCESCTQNYEIVSRLHRAEKAKSPGAQASASAGKSEGQTGCLSKTTIVEFLNGELLRSKRRDVEKHLAVCDECRQTLTEIFRAIAAEVSEEEKAILASCPPFEIDEQVRRIVDLMPKPATPEKGARGWAWPVVPAMPKPRPAIWRPALIFVLVLFIFGVGKWWAWPAFRYFHLVRKGQSLMAEQIKIYYLGKLRPAGNYHSSRFAQLMSAEEGSVPDAATALKKALAYNHEGEAARQALAQYYLLQEQYKPADSLLKILQAASPQSAAMLNDRGILFHHRAQYDSAALAFQRALALDPNLEEALYNLAITQTQLGDLAAAKQTWEQYLKLEVPIEWHNAAQTQRNALEEQ
jgi:hypothetical protein